MHSKSAAGGSYWRSLAPACWPQPMAFFRELGRLAWLKSFGLGLRCGDGGLSGFCRVAARGLALRNGVAFSFKSHSVSRTWPIFINSSWLFYDFFRPFRISSDVGAQKEMLLAYEKILAPATGYPEQASTPETESQLNITVVYTSLESTLVALKEAGGLASSLGARITLVVLQVVPYPLPLESPPVLVEFNERRFRIIANQSPVETRVRIYLCRDPLVTLTSVLSNGCIAVLGGRKRRWPTRENRLARQLRRAGHKVLLKERE
jgi:hypothetical protein